MTESSKPAWITESLRGTVFGDTSLDEAQEWWSQYVDIEPDSETVKSKAGRYSADCEFVGGVLSLEVQPGRVDWYLRSKREEDIEELKFPNFGPIDEPIEKFAEIFKKWVADRTGLKRIAFGGILLQPTEGRQAAYEAVQLMLPTVQIDVENSADLFYQINRPRPSTLGIDDLVLNRLCKWSVLRLSGGAYQVDTDQSLVSVGFQELFAVRIELDINTSPNSHDVLPVDRQADLFDELIALGLEISEKGDQP